MRVYVLSPLSSESTTDEGPSYQYESAGSSSSRSRSNRSRAYTRPGSQSRMTPVEVVPVDEGVGTESHFIPNPKTYWSNQYQQGFSRSPSNHSHAKTRSIGTARHTLAAGGSQFQAGMNQSELKHQEAERTNRGAERVDAWRHDVLYVPKAELKKKPTPPSEYLASKSTKARLESAARKDSVSQAQAKSRAAPTSSVAPKGSTKQLDGNKLPASTLNSRKLKQHLWARELLTNRSHPDWLTLINIYDEGAMQESERLNTAARVGSSSRHSSSRAGSPNGLSGIASQAGRDAASAGLSEASAGLPTFREKLRDILSCLLNVAYPEASRPATTARRARRSTRSDNRRY